MKSSTKKTTTSRSVRFSSLNSKMLDLAIQLNGAVKNTPQSLAIRKAEEIEAARLLSSLFSSVSLGETTIVQELWSLLKATLTDTSAVIHLKGIEAFSQLQHSLTSLSSDIETLTVKVDNNAQLIPKLVHLLDLLPKVKALKFIGQVEAKSCYCSVFMGNPFDKYDKIKNLSFMVSQLDVNILGKMSSVENITVSSILPAHHSTFCTDHRKFLISSLGVKSLELRMEKDPNLKVPISPSTGFPNLKSLTFKIVDDDTEVSNFTHFWCWNVKCFWLDRHKLGTDPQRIQTLSFHNSRKDGKPVEIKISPDLSLPLNLEFHGVIPTLNLQTDSYINRRITSIQSSHFGTLFNVLQSEKISYTSPYNAKEIAKFATCKKQQFSFRDELGNICIVKQQQ